MENNRLEPEYITKYGKQFHELYNKNIECYNKETYYQKYKNTFIFSFWEDIKENPKTVEDFYDSYNDIEYISEEECIDEYIDEYIETNISSESEEDETILIQ
jgi:hypothetical protein|tara:strand:+ start:63 stop:368 length:306 start_codon:yes stop_codon:yes gene_type:complete